MGHHQNRPVLRYRRRDALAGAASKVGEGFDACNRVTPPPIGQPVVIREVSMGAAGIGANIEFLQGVVKVNRQTENDIEYLGGTPRPQEWRGGNTAKAEASQARRQRRGLCFTRCVQRNVAAALKKTLAVPVGFAMPDKVKSLMWKHEGDGRE